MSPSEKRIRWPQGRDEPMAPTGESDEDEADAARAANKFDIRRLIGALFILYSLILIALGIFGSHTIKHKAAGINIDLWTGLGMLVFGVLMLFWAFHAPGSARARGDPRPGFRAPSPRAGYLAAFLPQPAT